MLCAVYLRNIATCWDVFNDLTDHQFILFLTCMSIYRVHPEALYIKLNKSISCNALQDEVGMVTKIYFVCSAFFQVTNSIPWTHQKNPRREYAQNIRVQDYTA